MFLWQNLNYKLVIIHDDKDMEFIKNALIGTKAKFVAWDTETTGLHLHKDVPFLFGMGFADRIYIFEPTKTKVERLWEIFKEVPIDYFAAHNAKFDYHMMRNFGTPIPKHVPIADTLALARLTDYVDTQSGYSLEKLGAAHVSENSKFAGKVIKEHLNFINKERRTKIKEYVKNVVKVPYMKFMDAYRSRVQFIEHPEWEEHFKKIDALYPPANYLDSYKERPNLMINYLADDIVLVLEIARKLESVLDAVDKGRKIWHTENKIIRVVGDMEARGLRVDIDYLLQSRRRVSDYRDSRYKEMHDLIGVEISAGQHEKIREIFATKYKIGTMSADRATLKEIVDVYSDDEKYKDAVKFAKLLIEIRTLDKVLSTYIDGMLNRIVGETVYTDINNSGTVTGRVSSDLQQQPKDPLLDSEGNELFHPRKVFITRDGYTNYYIDFNNMEMRVQAYYTHLVAGGDLNLCRAFMPFKCLNKNTGKLYKEVDDMPNWNSGEWIMEDGTEWRKTDLHTATTLQAFPDLTGDEEHFDEYRQLGKRVNFLKNYGGGRNKIMESLGLSEEVATALDNGYYKAFPKVLEYQKWVDNNVKLYGFAENLYGRRYYFLDARWAYKAYNYLVQGSCADYVKEKEIELDELLSKYESNMLLPIHDEIIFEIKNGEEFLVPVIKSIMEDAGHVIKTVPMVSTVECSTTNWADAKECK